MLGCVCDCVLLNSVFVALGVFVAVTKDGLLYWVVFVTVCLCPVAEQRCERWSVSREGTLLSWMCVCGCEHFGFVLCGVLGVW